jgi:3-dehydroquinate synthase
VDASIGGKLGIDFHGFKNHLGVFKTPVMVLIDPIFIATLSGRQIKSGFAEVIKHGLINDRSVFEDLSKINVDKVENWRDIIKRSIAIKGEIVYSDPLEKGPRKLLNFGHTIGHAIESYFMEDPEHNLLHGEAIAIGMVCESWLSNKKLKLPDNELDQINSLLLRIYGKTDLSALDINKFKENLDQDKKNKGNSLLFTLLHDLGYGKFDIVVSSEEALESLAFYKSL